MSSVSRKDSSLLHLSKSFHVSHHLPQYSNPRTARLRYCPGKLLPQGSRSFSGKGSDHFFCDPGPTLCSFPHPRSLALGRRLMGYGAAGHTALPRLPKPTLSLLLPWTPPTRLPRGSDLQQLNGAPLSNLRFINPPYAGRHEKKSRKLNIPQAGRAEAGYLRDGLQSVET